MMWGYVSGVEDQDFHGLSINTKQFNGKNCASAGNILSNPHEKDSDPLGKLPEIKNFVLPDGTENTDFSWEHESDKLSLFGFPYLTQRSMVLYEKADNSVVSSKGPSKWGKNLGRPIACCNIEDFVFPPDF